MPTKPIATLAIHLARLASVKLVDATLTLDPRCAADDPIHKTRLLFQHLLIDALLRKGTRPFEFELDPSGSLPSLLAYALHSTGVDKSQVRPFCEPLEKKVVFSARLDASFCAGNLLVRREREPQYLLWVYEADTDKAEQTAGRRADRLEDDNGTLSDRELKNLMRFLASRRAFVLDQSSSCWALPPFIVDRPHPAISESHLLVQLVFHASHTRRGTSAHQPAPSSDITFNPFADEMLPLSVPSQSRTRGPSRVASPTPPTGCAGTTAFDMSPYTISDIYSSSPPPASIPAPPSPAFSFAEPPSLVPAVRPTHTSYPSTCSMLSVPALSCGASTPGVEADSAMSSFPLSPTGFSASVSSLSATAAPFVPSLSASAAAFIPSAVIGTQPYLQAFLRACAEPASISPSNDAQPPTDTADDEEFYYVTEDIHVQQYEGGNVRVKSGGICCGKVENAEVRPIKDRAQIGPQDEADAPAQVKAQAQTEMKTGTKPKPKLWERSRAKSGMQLTTRVDCVTKSVAKSVGRVDFVSKQRVGKAIAAAYEVTASST